jgi:flagellar basal-body rod protein FlgG
MGAIEIAQVMLSGAARRVEAAAQNLSNLTTPAYKSLRSFPLDATGAGNSAVLRSDFTVGKLQETRNPFDLAISGSGFFAVRSADGILFTRNGQFRRDETGRLVTAQGFALQSTEGDVQLGDDRPAILADGTIVSGGQPTARLRIVDFPDFSAVHPVSGTLFAAAPGMERDAASPIVRQGMLEASNVSTATEMLATMAALRSAQTGQRIVQIYDDLMSRALTAFGQA